MSWQKTVFNKLVILRDPNTSPVRVGRWVPGHCVTEGGGEEPRATGSSGGRCGGSGGGLRVPFERATCPKNGHHLVSCHKQVFNNLLILRVANTSPVRVGRFWSAAGAGYFVTACAGRSPTPRHGKFGGPSRGGPGGAPTPLQASHIF